MDIDREIDEIITGMGLEQSRCLKCDVCCRFPDAASLMAPFFSQKEKDAAIQSGLSESDFPGCFITPGEQVLLKRRQSGYRCPAFKPADNRCGIYGKRPLDCRLYPFILMYDEPGTRVMLAADLACPFIYENLGSESVAAAAEKLAALLNGSLAETIVGASNLVSAHLLQGEPLIELSRLTTSLCRSDLGLARLTGSARERLLPYFTQSRARLFNYCFAAVYLWQDLFHIYWKIYDDMLLIFAAHDGLCFMMLPPLGEGDSAAALKEGWRIMQLLGKNGAGARVQEVSDALYPAMKRLHWQEVGKTHEYLYFRDDLAELKGNAYASKRHSINQFLKRGNVVYRPFVSDDIPAAAALLRRWRAVRAEANTDDYYRGQLNDAAALHLRTFKEGIDMGLTGRVVEKDGRMAAYTFGYPLPDGRTFAVFLEISDLNCRGAAQFIFREICRELKTYTYINTGSDSGLPNLTRVKESYRPALILPTYIMTPI